MSNEEYWKLIFVRLAVTGLKTKVSVYGTREDYPFGRML